MKYLYLILSFILVLSFQNCADPTIRINQVELASCSNDLDDSYAPKVTKQWTSELSGDSSLIEYKHILTPPMVADLNNDGKKELAFVSYKQKDAILQEGGIRGKGVFRIVNGEDLTDFIAPIGNGDRAPYATSTPLLLNIDGDVDRSVEIVYLGVADNAMVATKDKVVALNNDGSLRWSVPIPLTEDGSPQIGNCRGGAATAGLKNGTNISQILLENYLITESVNGDSAKLTEIGEYVDTRCTSFAMTVDAEKTNTVQLVTGSGVYKKNGLPIYAPFEGVQPSRVFLAGADIHPDYEGVEIVRVYSAPSDGRIAVVELHSVSQKKLIWSYQIPGTDDVEGNVSVGGPANISDINGDGHSDITIATADKYVSLSHDGKELWAKPTHDHSSAITGSSVFDFNGDGITEVLYSDEGYFRIYNGESGSIFKEFPNPSRTQFEYPVVANIDQDEEAEIIVISNDEGIKISEWPSTVVEEVLAVGAGFRVFESSDKPWASTRSVWNQYSYFVSNINSFTMMATESTPHNLETGEVQKVFRQNTMEQFSEPPCAK